MPAIRSLSIGLLMLSVTACGFHLRGELALASSLVPVYIVSDKDKVLRQELLALFELNAIEQARDRNIAASVLRIDSVERSRRVLSTDTNGLVREYELAYTLAYTFEGSDALKQQNTISLKRELVFDSSNVLAYNTESRFLYQDMQRNAARLILLQLQSVK